MLIFIIIGIRKRLVMKKILCLLCIVVISQSLYGQSWWSKLFSSSESQTKDGYHESLMKNFVTPDRSVWENEPQFKTVGEVINIDNRIKQNIKLSGNILENSIERLYRYDNFLILQPLFGNVYLYSANGKFQKELARKGRGPGEIEDLTSVQFSVFRDTIYVISNGSISTFLLNGTPLRRQYIGSFSHTSPLLNKNFLITNNSDVDPNNAYTIYIYTKENLKHQYSIRFEKEDFMNIVPFGHKTNLSTVFSSDNVITYNVINSSLFYNFDIVKKKVMSAYNIKHNFYKEPEKRKTSDGNFGDAMWFTKNYYAAYYMTYHQNKLIVFYKRDYKQEGQSFKGEYLILVADPEKKEIVKQLYTKDFKPAIFSDGNVYLTDNRKYETENEKSFNTIYTYTLFN